MRSLIVIPLIIALLCTGCGKAVTPPPETLAVSEEVIAYLTELNGKALDEMATETADLDRQIAEMEEKEEYLYEIKSRLDAAVQATKEEMAEREGRIEHYWRYTVSEEDLKLWQNEGYQLVKAELIFHKKDGGWDCFSDIIIMDKETEDTGTPESFETDLRETKSIYVNRKEAKLRVGQDAYQILTDVTQSKDAWKVSEVDNGVYSISGYGLGYTDQLSVGEWYYYEYSKTVEPLSPASIKLRDAIIGKM